MRSIVNNWKINETRNYVAIEKPWTFNLKYKNEPKQTQQAFNILCVHWLIWCRFDVCCGSAVQVQSLTGDCVAELWQNQVWQFCETDKITFWLLSSYIKQVSANYRKTRKTKNGHTITVYFLLHSHFIQFCIVLHCERVCNSNSNQWTHSINNWQLRRCHHWYEFNCIYLVRNEWWERKKSKLVYK